MSIKITDDWALAQENYQGYGDQVGWVNYQGKPMPNWEDLTDTIRLGWLAGAIRVKSLVKPDNLDRGIGSSGDYYKDHPRNPDGTLK